MEVIADILLISGALGAGIYCFVLSRRLRRFNDLETGVGGAVAVLSAQVDDLAWTLGAAQTVASASTRSLDGLTDRAETVARRLEMLVAAMHDIPQTSPPIDERQSAPAPQAARPARPLSPATAPQHSGDAHDGAEAAAPAPPAEPVFRRHATAATGTAS